MRYRCWFLTFFLLLGLGLPLIGEDSETKTDAVRSLREERERILRYGVDSTMIGLMDDLTKEKNNQFNKIIFEEAQSAMNPEVGIRAFSLFIATEDRIAEDWALEILKDDDLYGVKFLVAALGYLGEDLPRRAGDEIVKLLKHEERLVAQAAVTALGKSEDERYAEDLMALIDDRYFHEDLKTTVITALGDLKADAALELLTEIVEDEEEEKGLRWRACQALGKIAHPDSFIVISRLFADQDKVLRTYATEALGHYLTDDAEKYLIRALRDSAWDVRVKAASQLGERKSTEAVSPLIYMAESDPELVVKREAVKALGKIANTESLDFLQKLGSSTAGTNPQLWVLAVEILVEKDFSRAFEGLMKIVEQEWTKENSYFLNQIGIHFSKKEDAALSPVFERFLGHKEINIKLYGIRGIGLNRFSELKERLEEMTEDGQARVIRQNALDALERL